MQQILIASLILLFMLGSIHKAFASALTVSPPIIEIEAIPPARIESPIALRNDSEATVNLEVKFKPFIPSPKLNGEIQFLADTDPFPGANKRITERLELRENGKKITTVTLGPKEEKRLALYVGLPENEIYSDYYFTVAFLPKETASEDSNDENNGSNIVGGIGLNVLLSVGPRNDAKGLIEEYSSPGFVQSGPVPFGVTIKNTGRHYFSPTGEITITNMFGQKIGKVRLLSSHVLSGTSRVFSDEVSLTEELKKQDQAEKAGLTPPPGTDVLTRPQVIWPERFLVGPYTASLHVKLAEDGPILERQIRFFAFPGQFLAALIVIIALLFIIRQRVRKRLSAE